LRICYEGIHDAHTDEILEFDTEESARDWRREFHGSFLLLARGFNPRDLVAGAVFLYRQSRRRALDPDAVDDANGVRFNVPLSRLEGAGYSSYMSFAFLIKIKVSSGSSHRTRGRIFSEHATSGEYLSSQKSLSNAGRSHTPLQVTAEESDMTRGTQLLQIAVLKDDPAWRELVHLADAARDYEKAHGFIAPQAHFDFDCSAGTTSAEGEGQVQFKSLAGRLGFNLDSEPWSASHPPVAVPP
jgi:sterol 3beta-glucosyltransferase